MGQAGSQPIVGEPQRGRRANTLPHEPLRHAPKVLPSLTESPRLRSTDNGAILHSGGTISGRKPVCTLQDTSRAQHGHMHSNLYRTRSAQNSGESGDLRTRERDPLHRSHTNLSLKPINSNILSKKFGSEPDLRIEEEQQVKQKMNNKHFRKKYRAPPPPSNDNQDVSSPDSSDVNSRSEPQRKLRLFRTRNETKKLNGQPDLKLPTYKSFELSEHEAFERRYRSPCKEKHFSYSDNSDMIQSTCSLQLEENLIHTKYDTKKSKIDRLGGCRAKTSKINENNDGMKTPLLNRNFRYSERFKREESEQPSLRREKTFDSTLTTSKKEIDSPRAIHKEKMKVIGKQLKASRLSQLSTSNEASRKSLPSLLIKNSEEKDEFQVELKKATSRIRNELGNKIVISENKPSHVNNTDLKNPNPTRTQNKVKESSLISSSNNDKNTNITNSRKPLSRLNETKIKSAIPLSTANKKSVVGISKEKPHGKENGNKLSDRGQASGKESTPEHSPIRKKIPANKLFVQEKQNTSSSPSKQFYFGMMENKRLESKDRDKDFPGLKCPAIEEFRNFHLIEEKLLGYHEEDAEFDKFTEKLKLNSKTKNLSSESALSSEGSEGEGSDCSMGIAVRLRPTPPKKQPTVPRFSPAEAWRQLASLELASQTQPLAVETKVSHDIAPESPPRSEVSGDKSGDSGISGDHVNSDPRIDSPIRHAAEACPPQWTPQQDLGDSSSDGAGGGLPVHSSSTGLVTYNPGAQPFSLSLPRDNQDKGKQLQQGFNSLQKLRKSVSGALGAALGSRRFDLEHESLSPEPEQNWFLTKSAPNSLSNPMLFQKPARVKGTVEEDIKEEVSLQHSEKDHIASWQPGNSYLSLGGHIMYLPPATTVPEQPLSMPGPFDRPVRSKSSGSLEVAARAARAAALAGEMRERERSASPEIARAVPARVKAADENKSPNNQSRTRGKRFTFQSTVRQLERRKLAEKLSKEADLKEQQRKTELEAMRRVEEEFQRKRAREKANIRQQLRLVVNGTSNINSNGHQSKSRDDPEGSCRGSPAPDRPRDGRARHSNASSEISGRSKSTTPVRCVELSEWRTDNEARVYRDWAGAALTAHAHPPACARMPKSTHVYNATEVEAFSGSPRSDNYRLEFARGRSPRTPRTPRAPRILSATRTPSSSGSELSLRQPIKIREPKKEEPVEPPIVPVLRPTGPRRSAVFSH